MKDHFILGGDWSRALQPKETIQSPTESESALATQPLPLAMANKESVHWGVGSPSSPLFQQE